MLSDRPILAFPKVFITFYFYPMYGKCSFPCIALPTLGNCYLMGKKKKNHSSCISLINGEIEVIFICLLATFIMDCLFMSFTYNSFSVGLCVDLCCWVFWGFCCCSASLSLLSGILIYCGEPIPCGLDE